MSKTNHTSKKEKLRRDRSGDGGQHGNMSKDNIAISFVSFFYVLCMSYM